MIIKIYGLKNRELKIENTVIFAKVNKFLLIYKVTCMYIYRCEKYYIVMCDFEI